jgi:hypothetical protein
MHPQTETDTHHLLYTPSHGELLATAVRSEEVNHSFSIIMNNASTRISSPRPAHQLSLFQSFQETWILEFLGLLCSAAGLIIIMIILLKYDGQQRPTWYISINAVVSILSAVVNIGALYSVTHGVNQLKWVWLSEKTRKLADIQTFDSGSRGVLGAMTLLLHLRARYACTTFTTLHLCRTDSSRHLAALGAVAIILRIGIDPSIQNVIHFRDGVIVDETQASYIARTTIYRDKGPESIYQGECRSTLNGRRYCAY